jgi:hypothetical protein
VALGDSSWDVRIVVHDSKFHPTGPDGIACGSLDFTMHLQPDADGLNVTSGSRSGVVTGRLVSRNGGYENDGDVGLPGGVWCGSSAAPQATATTLSLTAFDTDGDGVADQLAGGGSGSSGPIPVDEAFGVPVSSPFTFALDLSGTSDVTRPQLFLSDVLLQPLGRLAVWASEPLAPSSHLFLQGTVPVDLQPLDPPATGAFTSVYSENVTLPFSGRWTLAGHAEDLSGLSVDPLPADEITTYADPGVFAADGFEGDGLPRIGSSGGGRVVTGIGSVPALNGARSLLVEPGPSVSLHLTRPPGASSVRMSARFLRHDAAPPPEGLAVWIGVIGKPAELGHLGPGAGAAIATGDKSWEYAGPVQDLSTPIHESGTDLVLSLQPSPCFASTCVYGTAVVIDDLRVE